jgi:hypothetical protein
MADEIQDATITQTQEASTGPSLQLSDLVLALQTIQACSQRGAVRAEEMTTVGGLYDRLLAFLEAQGAVTRSAPPATAEGETPNA